MAIQTRLPRYTLWVVDGASFSGVVYFFFNCLSELIFLESVHVKHKDILQQQLRKE